MMISKSLRHNQLIFPKTVINCKSCTYSLVCLAIFKCLTKKKKNREGDCQTSENLSFLEPVGDNPHCPALFIYLVCNRAALIADRTRHGEWNGYHSGKNPAFQNAFFHSEYKVSHLTHMSSYYFHQYLNVYSFIQTQVEIKSLSWTCFLCPTLQHRAVSSCCSQSTTATKKLKIWVWHP